MMHLGKEGNHAAVAATAMDSQRNPGGKENPRWEIRNRTPKLHDFSFKPKFKLIRSPRF